jgi:hypothetical protein
MLLAKAKANMQVILKSNSQNSYCKAADRQATFDRADLRAVLSL